MKNYKSWDYTLILIIMIFLAAITISSCKKDKSITPTTIPSPIEASYHESSNTWDFQPIGPCFTTISWSAPNRLSDIYTLNGQTWMDSLNYVMNRPVPVLITSSSSISFQDYYYNNNTIHITGGTGYLHGDTLVVSINAENTSGCLDPYVIHGKYYK